MKLSYLSDDYHYAITRMAIYAAELDHVIELVIDRYLQKQPETAKFIVKNTATDRMVELARAVLKDARPSEASQIDAVFSNIRECRTERNTILHALVDERATQSGSVAFVRSRPHREETRAERSPIEIGATADTIRECSDALYEFARNATA